MHRARTLGALGTLLILAIAAPAAAQTWTQLTPSPDPTYGSPSPRQGHTAVYNPTSNRMIVFGGGGAGGYGLVGDTWVLTHADGQGGTPAWVRLLPSAPDGAPGPMEWHTAVYDVANNRMILHGGYTAPGSCPGVMSATWILTNADGTGGTPQWVPSVPGPPRRFSGPAYDAANNRMIIHGGQAAGCGATNDDTWVLSEANGLGGAGTWTLLAPSGPRSLPGTETAAYDPASNTLIVFDLRCDASGCWNVIRRLTGANGLTPDPTWQQLNAEVSTRYWQCGAYDASRKNLLVFGGQWTVSLNDTLVLSNADGQETPTEWSTIAVAGTLPPGRGFCSAVYNPTSERLIIFGGAGGNLQTPYNDVWVLSEILGPQDTTAPTTVAALSPLPNAAGWNAAAVTVNLAAADEAGGSGVKEIVYWATGAQETAATHVPGSSASLNIEADGITVLHFYALDNADNQEAEQARTIQIDSQPPQISIAVPGSGAYLLNQALTANYACTDSGSGVASCVGTAVNGGSVDTSSIGVHPFTVSAADHAGNTSSATVDYNVTYNACLLYSPQTAKKSGSTYPIKLRLCTADGANVSTPDVVLTAIGITQVSGAAPGALDDAGDSNPDMNFRYDAGLGGYIFNLKLTGFSTGTYNLVFRAGDDPLSHTAQFQVK